MIPQHSQLFPVSESHDSLLGDSHESQYPALSEPGSWHESMLDAWRVIRPLLIVWAGAVWILFILIPAIKLVKDTESALTHLPYVAIGLTLLGAMACANALRKDAHLVWFLLVLLMLAGWV